MKKLIISLTLILLGVLTSVCNAMEITVLDVGQGDSILIESDGETILVDTGPPESRDKLMTALSGVQKIDKLILTHPHADHIGNAFYLIENLPVGIAYDNGEISASSYYLNYLAGLSLEGIERVTLSAGDNLKTGDITFQILNPASDFDSNNNSLVFRLVYKNFSMLFTGDIGYMAEADILSRGCAVKSNILKAAHHGAKTSSAYNFVRAVRPEVVVISAGANNRYGHPHADSLTAFRLFTDQVFCTAFNSSIYIYTDGDSYSVTPTFSANWLSNFPLSDSVTRVERLD